MSVEMADGHKDTYAIFVTITYVAAIVAVGLFFVVEDAPWHYSRRVESTYLSIALLSIYVASVSVGWPYRVSRCHLDDVSSFNPFCQEDDLTDPAMVAKTAQIGLLAIRHIIQLVIIVFISTRVLNADGKMAWFDECVGLSNRQERLMNLIQHQPVFVRISRELNATMAELENLLRESLILPTTPLSMSLVILVLLMGSDMLVVHPTAWKAVFYASRLGQACVWLWIICLVFRGWRMYSNFAVQAEEQLCQVVKSKNKTALQYLLATVSIRALLQISRSMLKLLTGDALASGLYDNQEKAMIIFALQNIGLRRSTHRQQAVERIILSTRSEELTELKRLLDGTGTYHNLYKLVYHDISSTVIKEKIIAHIKEQARAVREKPHYRPGIKVCSDIDDTLYSSGGHFPAGCDKLFPKGVPYPGCLTLFRVLDKGWQPGCTSSNLAFLSARPHVYKSWAEQKSYDLFRELVEQDFMHSMPTMIPGQLGLGLWAMLTYPCFKNGAWRRVGEFKYLTYKKFAKLYLEYDFVFCGDDGQGDLWAGQRMTRNGRSEMVLDEILDDDTDDSDIDSEETEDDGSTCGSSSDDQDPSVVRSSTGRSASRLLAGQLSKAGASATTTSIPSPPQDNGAILSSSARRVRISMEPDEIFGGAQGTEEDHQPDGLRHQQSTGSSCSESLTLNRSSGGRIVCVLIHEVCDKTRHTPLTLGSTREERGGMPWRSSLAHRDRPPHDERVWRESMERRRLFFHRSYVGAAVVLHRLDPQIVSLDDVETIAHSAIQEFEEARLMYPEMQRKLDIKEQRLNLDLVAANELLLTNSRQPLRPVRNLSQVDYDRKDDIEDVGLRRTLAAAARA